MDVEYDSAKSERCLRERGFDFAFAALLFNGRTIEQPDERRDCGESRIKAVGEIDRSIYTVVYTERDGIRRIISARAANARERKTWRSSG